MPISHHAGNDDNGEHLKKLVWHTFRNDNGSDTIPGFGVMRVTGYDLTSDVETPFMKVDRPNTFGAQGLFALNGPQSVRPGDKNDCTLGETNIALYDSADGTPAVGELWGPRNGTWKLKKSTPGFRVLGVLSTTQALVLVAPELMTECLGVCTSGYIQAGNSGTFEIYAGTLGSETGTGSTVSAFVREGMSIQNEIHRLRWVVDHWEVANPCLSFRGATSGSAAPGATCTVGIYYWGGSSWSASATTIASVLNDLDVTVASAANVQCKWNERVSVPGWRIIQSSYTCP